MSDKKIPYDFDLLYDAKDIEQVATKLVQLRASVNSLADMEKLIDHHGLREDVEKCIKKRMITFLGATKTTETTDKEK